MTEPRKAFDLSPEQRSTVALLDRLLGQRIADRYVDFCLLAAGALPLRVSSPIAAHALRELESILRQTLEVPMEAGITPGADDLVRVEKAKAQLTALGFRSEEIERAVNQLRPRLSHKEQIERIVTRLGLAVDGDIATAWKAISQAHGEAHGGRALHQSIAVNDAFRAEWQAPFDVVMRGLMIALQGKYAAFMRRIDQLVAMPDPSVAVTNFSKEIPGALPLLWHFFNRLETPDWLPHLAGRNLLLAPVTRTDDTRQDGLLLREWPAGRYLLRMARSTDPETRTRVVEALQAVGTSTHPDVQQMGLEILAALPPREAAPIVALAESWLTPQARFIMAQAPHDLIKSLAQGGEAAAALRVTAAVFKVFSEDGRLATLFSRHMYEHHLPQAVEAIAPLCKVEAVALLANLLEQAVHAGGKVKSDPPHDYTYYLSTAVSEHGMKHDVTEALVGEIARAARLAMESDPACTRDVVLRIRDHKTKIFTRISLHVLSINPGGAPDLAHASLVDHDLIEETWCHVEYGELARAWFPSLPAAAQDGILAYIDSVPDKYRERFNARFEEHEKRRPTAAEQKLRDESLIRDLVWHWRDVLPGDRRARAEKLGDPDAWRERLYEEEKSPLPRTELTARPIEDVVACLQTWRPTEGEQRETATALAQELREAATANPILYSTHAWRFAQLAPIYVRRLLEALTNAVRNQNDLDWRGTLTLIEVIVRPDMQRPDTDLAGDDPDWSWARKVACEVIAAGLRRGADGIPFVHASPVQALGRGLVIAHPDSC